MFVNVGHSPPLDVLIYLDMSRQHDYSIPSISIPIGLKKGGVLVILHPRSFLRREIHIRVISPLELISKDIEVLQRLLSRQIMHLLRRRIKIDRIRRALAIVSIAHHQHLFWGIAHTKECTGAPRLFRDL